MRVALLGTGLIGGSIGLALRRGDEATRIVGYDRDPAAARRAVERGAADEAAGDPAEAADGADVVVVATPVLAIPGVVAAAAPGLRAGTIVSDVGSTKARIVREVEPLCSARGATFIGGHPMAGTEEEGIEAAGPTLFEGAWWILTPTPSVDPDSYKTLHRLLSGLGAQVMALDPDHHDRLLALISHLPHLTAATLMTLALDHSTEHAGLLALAAGGFRDVTRVAASNPEIWLDICSENGPAVALALEEFAGRLQRLRDLVAAGEREALREVFIAAREGRRSLPGRRAGGELCHVVVPIPDRPGVLGEVTREIGQLGINIEDLEITHAEEGGRGALRLTILGAEEARRVVVALAAAGHEPRTTSL